jgi:hypothetical protein
MLLMLVSRCRSCSAAFSYSVDRDIGAGIVAGQLQVDALDRIAQRAGAQLGNQRRVATGDANRCSGWESRRMRIR